MYDTVISEFDYSKDGAEYNIDSKVYLEDNSLLIDRKYKDSNDAIATQRIRYYEIDEVVDNGASAKIVSKKGTVYLKAKDSVMVKDFCDKLRSIVEDYNRTY
ncbi:hypothetical protein [Methanobrevibacter sp.]|uniref:hypothetical protein n=1 Tax=Methanobrevibacter sp. TaxID=66852 RepID=UPI0038664E47